MVNGVKHSVIPLPWLHDIFSGPVRARITNPDLKLSALARSKPNASTTEL
jgi:hypothetical protein